MLGVEQGDGAEHLDLIGGAEAVAGLDLDGGRAMLHGEIQPLQAARHQLIQAGLARGLHGAVDPAALSHDLLVGRALDAPLELLSAIAGPDEVRVRIDQAGCHQPAGSVNDSIGRVGGGDALGQAGGLHGAVEDGQSAIFDQAQVAQGVATLRAAVVRRYRAELAGAGDQQIDVLAHGHSPFPGDPDHTAGAICTRLP